jgi:hypothetical protein
MERDLHVHNEDIDRLRSELCHVVEFFRGMGHERCDVFFGWAWRDEQDETDLAMKSMNIPLLDLNAEVREAEAAGLGNFGGDDVWVSFEGLALKIQFCHHEGIHLSYSEPDEMTRHFLDRWQAGGLDPKEFEKPDGGSDWRPPSVGSRNLALQRTPGCCDG